MDNLRSRIIDLAWWLCNNAITFEVRPRFDCSRFSRGVFQMQINVLRELRQPVGSVAVFDVAELRVRIDDLELANVSGSLTLLRTDGGLLASLEATATMTEPCARCLVTTECTVHVRFEEEYTPVVDANSGARVRGVAPEGDFRIGPDFMLDLGPPLREYVLMSEPLKPLCRPDCAGLCPSCGADLNGAPCACPPDVDERWGTLVGFEAKATKGR